MSDHQHYTDCHLHHFPCALERIRDLERELSGWRVSHGHAIPCEGVLTTFPEMAETVWYEGDAILQHPVAIPMHGPGPTWAHKVCDEPPVR